MLTERASGIILHISSLPSYGGIGDLGPAAYRFVDFLAAAKQQYWLVLPLGPTGYGNSPYSALSAFAGNPLFISLETLVDQHWLGRERLAGLSGADGPVDFERVIAIKMALLEEAAGNFVDQCNSGQCSGDLRNRFVEFCREQAHWLDDYARFSVLRRMFAGASWHTWPEEYRGRSPKGLKHLQAQHARALAWSRLCNSSSPTNGMPCAGTAEKKAFALPGRHRNLRELRQRRRVDASRDFRAG